MNNKVKECNIDFVIDKTPPTVVITGIEESSYRADEREMTINLSDNTAVKCVDVTENQLQLMHRKRLKRQAERSVT